MAMVWHHSKGNNGGGQRERARPYGLMLLLAFVAAILGVMALQKLRERRIHNLLLKDKDRELFSLHLLLQKERDNANEMRKKVEEMRAKIYLLRTQKLELDSRLLEMKSTISSMKDEQRTMEMALEEKQDEIKVLHEKELDRGKRQIQESSLQEMLKQKEDEIADLKRQIESMNVRVRGSETQKGEMDKLEGKQESGLKHGLHGLYENSTVTGGAEETGRKLDQARLQNQLNMTEDVSGGSWNSVEKGKGNDSNAIQISDDSAKKVDAVVEGNVEPKKLEETEKSEQPGDGHGDSGSRIQRKLDDGNGSRVRGKRWRVLARNRRLGRNGKSATMKHKRFIEDAVEIIEGKKLGDNERHDVESRRIGEESRVEEKEQEMKRNPRGEISEVEPTVGNSESAVKNPANGGEKRSIELESREVGIREGNSAARNIRKGFEKEVSGYPEEEGREADADDSRDPEAALKVEEHGDEYKEEADGSEF